MYPRCKTDTFLNLNVHRTVNVRYLQENVYIRAYHVLSHRDSLEVLYDLLISSVEHFHLDTMFLVIYTYKRSQLVFGPLQRSLAFGVLKSAKIGEGVKSEHMGKTIRKNNQTELTKIDVFVICCWCFSQH